MPRQLQREQAEALSVLSRQVTKAAENITRLAIAQEGEIVGTEYRMRHANGEWRWLYGRDTVFSRTAEGLPHQILGTATDISDRKQAEQQIREQAALLDVTTDAILVHDLDNQILFWNKGAERLYGWKAEEALNQNVYQLLYQKKTYAYKVLTASDGIEAIALYAQHKQDISVVLVDMMMPSMDGPTTIRMLKKMNPQVKIIAVSGLTSNQFTQAADPNVKAFLSKPYTAKELLQAVYTILKGNG